MEGPDNDRGINFRSLKQLFELKKEREDEFEYTIEVSLLEIYNEEIIDLLKRSPEKKSGTKSKRTVIQSKLEIKRDSNKKNGKGNYVPGLTMVSCNSHEDVLALMSHGYSNRSVHGTDMNAHSSRSHCALSVYVQAQSIIDGSITKSKLHLIDLAGSERLSKSGAEGDRKKEAQAINKSLSSLGDVINARMNKLNHVPYRNSTLTYLLQDSLSGNSKTLMIVQASPVDYNLSETQATLNWGQRARSVELGQAKKNKL
jgi:kinesin family protein C2/C3